MTGKNHILVQRKTNPASEQRIWGSWSQVNIEDLTDQIWVAYYDFNTNSLNERAIDSIDSEADQPALNVKFENGIVIKCTDNQPFYKKDVGWVAHNHGNSQYTDTAIAVGEEILRFDGTYDKVESIEDRDPHTMYLVRFGLRIGDSVADNNNLICNGFVLHLNQRYRWL